MAPPPLKTGKQRATRIPLDYYRHRDRLESWKRWLTGGAFLLVLGWVLSGLVWTDQGRLRYSRGPLATVHATWETKCDACHVAYEPMSGENWMSRVVVDAHTSDEQCRSCHAGPEHSARQFPQEVQSCAGCHRDHRGRDASLTRVADSECTRCHADIAAHTQGSDPQFLNVGRIEDHPRFKIFRSSPPEDPGKLKFSHKRHLTPGMALPEGGPVWTIDDIREPGERERYRRQQPENRRKGSDAVQLDCTSCHRTDSGDFPIQRKELRDLPAAILPARSPGAYMIPITYEVQCRACHPLTFDTNFPQLKAPHRRQPDALNEFLRATYTAQYLSANPKLLERQLPPRLPLPGRQANVSGEEEKKAREYIEAKVREAEKSLYLGSKTCGECHQYDGLGAAIPKRIVSPALPEIWFAHAKFNHAAHRAVECTQCHTNAGTSEKSSDVLVPDIDTCVKCHSPLRSSAGMVQGGARFDCTECHRYHQGSEENHYLQGIGAHARDPRQRLGIGDFLRGGFERSK
jgi:hypothetical protein